MNLTQTIAPSSTKVITLSDLYRHFDQLNSASLTIARTSPLKYSDPRIGPYAQRADRVATLIRRMDVAASTPTTGYIDFSVN